MSAHQRSTAITCGLGNTIRVPMGSYEAMQFSWVSLPRTCFRPIRPGSGSRREAPRRCARDQGVRPGSRDLRGQDAGPKFRSASRTTPASRLDEQSCGVAELAAETDSVVRAGKRYRQRTRVRAHQAPRCRPADKAVEATPAGRSQPARSNQSATLPVTESDRRLAAFPLGESAERRFGTCRADRFSVSRRAHNNHSGTKANSSSQGLRTLRVLAEIVPGPGETAVT